MVVVLREPKLIFIEEPRTASRSTHLWLTQQVDGISPWPGGSVGFPGFSVRHTGASVFKAMVQAGKVPRVSFLKDRVDEFLFFAFVRNPFNTLVTYYHKACNGKLGRTRRAEIHIAKSSTSFKHFVKTILEQLPGMLNEQLHHDRLDLVKHTLRFEDGHPRVLYKFLEERGVAITQQQKASFPFYGKTPNKREDWRSHYDDEAKEIVAGIYPTYLQRYNYTFDDG